MFAADNLPRIRTIIPSTSVDSTADKISLSSYFAAQSGNISLEVLTGNVWINPNATATIANGLKRTAGQTIDFNFTDSFSIISDANGATFQAVLWE